jgi:hypothetical protein
MHFYCDVLPLYGPQSPQPRPFLFKIILHSAIMHKEEIKVLGVEKKKLPIFTDDRIVLYRKGEIIDKISYVSHKYIEKKKIKHNLHHHKTHKIPTNELMKYKRCLC